MDLICALYGYLSGSSGVFHVFFQQVRMYLELFLTLSYDWIFFKFQLHCSSRLYFKDVIEPC